MIESYRMQLNQGRDMDEMGEVQRECIKLKMESFELSMGVVRRIMWETKLKRPAWELLLSYHKEYDKLKRSIGE